MPIQAVAKISADVGNGVVAGTDGGLFLSGNQQRGVNPTYLIDNSWSVANGATYYYQPSSFTPSNYSSFPINTAALFPIMFTANCVISQAPACVRTVQAGAKMYLSLYGSSATTGLPSVKVADLFTYNATVAGVAASTVVTPCPVLSANTLYWGCAWSNSYTTMQVYIRNASQALPGLRVSAPNANNGALTQYLSSYADTSANWTTAVTTAPSILAPVSTDYATAGGAIVPYLWWGLTNV